MAGKARTIVVTGASSGIGKATAQFFNEKGWNVIATVRDTSAENALVESDRFRIVQLDVQNPASIATAVATALAAFGTIDVWVNNAGYGAYGPVEAASRAQIQRQYAVNVFGLIECVQAIAPHYKPRPDGKVLFPFRRLFLVAYR